MDGKSKRSLEFLTGLEEVSMREKRKRIKNSSV